ncbi:response regulator transcription factor [Gracilibacillus sp. YIM 98692]|uniref:response regulator transcription factor n=1 Tax=Gracilibacillus sp. YIM 98692 TaxID=2663532 RepID=UPI0013D89D71|nr:response regulator transcription factor [Gracilibacillus sp. YIM 98692]
MEDFYKVLIVDDEMLIRQGIINYIEWESEGYKIIGEASNGEEAIHLMETYQPQIMITDIVMPGMDGIELVKYVKDEYPDTEIIVLSSFEDFDYVRQTFQSGVADYILKPKLNTDELIQTLRRVTQKQTKSSSKDISKPSVEEGLKKILEGYQSIRDMDLARKHFPYDSFNLIEMFWKKDKEISLSKKMIVNVLNDHVQNILCHEIPIKENSIVLLVNVTEKNLRKVKEVIQSLSKQTIDNKLHIKWILSKPFYSIDELKKVHENDHIKMKQYHFYLPNSNFLPYDDLPALREIKIEFDLNHMIYLFKRKQFQEAFIYLNEHIGLLSNQYETDVFEFKSWLENIMFNIIVLLGNMKYDIQALEAEKYTYFSDINEAFHVREAVSIFDHFMEKVENMVLPSNIETTSNIQRLLDYIEEHYNDHLSLQTLANHFHFNPSYLSSYFSKHHEEGFSEYLNHVRIKNAMKMLKSTDMSISTISEAVGYSDPSYFTKVFKKMTTKSPSTFRRENKTTNMRHL